MVSESTASTRPLRADARRNRDQILAAARDVFVEHGASAPLEEIARRAGTGIATLYRRFPDRQALMRAVVLDALERTIEESRAALAEEPDAFDALTRYLHRVLDLRTAAVIPVVMNEFPYLEDAEIGPASTASAQVIQRLVDAAHAQGTLRRDVTFGDLGLMVVRLSRPLHGPFTPEVNKSLGHRHLDLLIDGLRVRDGSAGPLGGPAIELDDLRAMREQDPGEPQG